MKTKLNRLTMVMRLRHPDSDEGAPAEPIADEELETSDEMSQDQIDDLIEDFDAVAEEAPASEPEPEEPEPESAAEAGTEEESESNQNDDDPEKEQEPEPEPEAEKPEVKEEPEPEPEPEVVEQQEEQPPEKSVEEFQAELEERYGLSEKDAEVMVTHPEKVLPKLAANMHMQIVTDVIKAVGAMIPQQFAQVVAANPQIIKQTMQKQTDAEAMETKFYESFPELQKKEHEATTVAAIQTVGKNFPKLSKEEKMQKAGQVAMVMLGLTPTVEKDPPAEKAAEPFVPASTANSSSPAASPVAENKWEEFL